MVHHTVPTSESHHENLTCHVWSRDNSKKYSMSGFLASYIKRKAGPTVVHYWNLSCVIGTVLNWRIILLLGQCILIISLFCVCRWTMFFQGWEIAHSLIAHSLICSFAHFAQIKWATVSDSLRSLKTNERPWAIRSGCSEEMSDCEWFAQVPQRKWGN